jgi:hypothetical protein
MRYIYIIVKELPPIILSGDTKERKYKNDTKRFWEPRKVVIDFIEGTSGDVYDENNVLIDDDIVKFDNYEDALDYCKIKNEMEKNNVKD